MKMHINREEKKKGMLKKKDVFVLNVFVELSDDEMKAIKKTGLDEFAIHETEVHGEPWTFGISSFATGKGMSFEDENIVIIDKREETIKNKIQALSAKLKEYLEKGGTKEEVIEL